MGAFNVKTRKILLASAARTTAQVYGGTAPPTSEGLVERTTFKDAMSLGVRFYLNVTVASGTGGLKVLLRGYDTISGVAVALTQGGSLVTAQGLYVYEVYPGIAETIYGNVQERRSSALPLEWDVQVTVGDSSSYTYSLSCEVLQ